MKKTEPRYLGEIYTLSAHMLAPDLRKKVANTIGRCHALVEHQLDAESFRVRVAKNWEMLQSEDGAYICVLTKQQLDQDRRIGNTDASNLVQVAPAYILPVELRLLHSSAGLCYYTPTGRPDQEGVQEVTVAALPERLHPYGKGRLGTILLNEKQRRCALDLTPDLTYLPTCDLRERVLAYCSEAAPDMMAKIAEEELAIQQQSDMATESEIQQEAKAMPTSLQPLEKVFVPLDVLGKVAHRMQEMQAGNESYRREKLLLRAILHVCMLKRTTLSRELDWHVRQVLVVHLYRRDLPQLIEVDPVYRKRCVVGYEIQVSLPVEQQVAA